MGVLGELDLEAVIFWIPRTRMDFRSRPVGFGDKGISGDCVPMLFADLVSDGESGKASLSGNSMGG